MLAESSPGLEPEWLRGVALALFSDYLTVHSFSSSLASGRSFPNHASTKWG